MKFTPEILYEDADLLVVNKPPGITIIPERFDKEKESLQALLEKQHGKLFVVHRIDRETSGVICFAKNEVAHKNLSQQFEHRQVGKIYLALVKGKVQPEAGTIDKPISENPAHPGTMVTGKKGKEALTLYKVNEQFKSAALLEVEIKTGRTHQVRVHLASIGNPLLVDSIYSNTGAFYFSGIKRNYKATNEEERPTIARLTLHAFRLSLKHPSTGADMEFSAPSPKDIEVVLKLLRKYDR